MNVQKSKHSDHSLLCVLWAVALIVTLYPVSAWMIASLSAAAVKTALGTVFGLLILSGVALVRGESKR